MNSITVAMIDDDKIVSDSVSTFVDLKSDFIINHTFSTAEEFIAFNFTSSPQILILDVGLPGISGIDAIPIILKKFPSLDIIILTTYEEEDVIVKALCAGACSYISKRAGLTAIAEAISIVANGGSYMSPRIAKEISKHFFSKSITKATEIILSTRQKEVMDFLVEGYTYSQISDKLSISVETVRSHIKKTYKTLHVNNKSEAIATYIAGNKQ
jgi:DNA-binding NarL/FixJ family response regulator